MDRTAVGTLAHLVYHGRAAWRPKLMIPALVVLLLAQSLGLLDAVAQGVGSAPVMRPAGAATGLFRYSAERLGFVLLGLSAASFAAAWHYAGKKRVFL